MAPQTGKSPAQERMPDRVYLVKRPYKDINQMVLGGYKVNEKAGENGGIVVGSKKEATRLASLRGWEWERVLEKEYRPQPLPKVTENPNLDGVGPAEKTLMREAYRTLSYEALKSEANMLHGRGAPDIALNSPKEKLLTYIVRWKPIYGDQPED
jgi:hypothetical protein